MKQDEKILQSEEGEHTAMGVIAGYYFQFYFFLYKVLTMECGTIVSFEKLDDTATEEAQAITLFQVKHTIQAALVGKDKPLTNRASDLWKTLDVWRKFITIESGNVRSEEKQQTYINTHNFVMVSNKNCENNQLIKLCNNIREGKIADNEIDRIFDNITAEAKIKKDRNNEETGEKQLAPASVVQTQINALKDFKYRREFLSKITFESMSFDDIEQQCLAYIRHLWFPENQVQDVFNDFKIAVVNDFTECAKSGKPLLYDYGQKLNRFEAIFRNKRTESLDFGIKKENFKPDFLELVCIRQLIEVGDVNKKNIDKIARVVSYYLSFKNRFNELLDNYKITNADFENFEGNTIGFWRNHFERVYDGIDEYTDEKEIIDRAKQLLEKVRDFEVSLCKEKLLIPISNGAFYYLSDECKIGWHHKWEDLFNKNQ